MKMTHRIAPCLWFDDQAEEAVRFYLTIFKNSNVLTLSRYGKAGKEVHHKPEGSVLAIAFELEGQPFTALNGGPQFKFNEAMSLQVYCESQEEVDYYWKKLSEGGDENVQQCGWLKDKYGVSWQVVPTMLLELIGDPKSEKSQRAMRAMMGMKKIVIEDIKRAYAG